MPSLQLRDLVHLEPIDSRPVALRLDSDTRCVNALASALRCNSRLRLVLYTPPRARIARGAVKDIGQANAADFDALIVPGGFGAAKNLSNFAVEGAGCSINPQVLALAEAFAEAGKPVGLICISPALAAKIYGPGVTCTIGNDADTAAALDKMGATHVECTVEDIVEDPARKLVSTPQE